MDEEQNTAVTREFAIPDPLAENQEQPAEQPVHEEAPDKPPEEDPAERNWREARRKMEAMESEIERLRQEREFAQQQQAPQEPDWNLDSDGWVTGQDLEKYTEKTLSKEIDRRVQEHLQQREHQEAPTRLRSNYTDFDQVVNEDALQRLKSDAPELFETIMASSADPYKRGAAVYRILKQSVDPTAEANRAKAEQNHSRPKSIDSANAGSPLADIGTNHGILTEERKAQIRQRMRAIQGRA